MNLLLQQGSFALLCAFFVGHALADFPLQGEWLATRKNRRTAADTGEWIVALAAHATIHAGAVWLVSGSLALGIVEFFAHALIDFGKSAGKYGLAGDQLLHLACKAGYVVFLMWGAS